MMPLKAIYLLRSTTERYAFREKNRDFMFVFFSFARGPMNILATFANSPMFWQYAVRMFSSFCDDGYRMVIGIQYPCCRDEPPSDRSSR
jgi:hypothetical protein